MDIEKELKRMNESIYLDSMTENKNLEQSEKDLTDDLIFYYEIDLDNCKMNNRDWVELLASVMISKESRNELLKEIEDYKNERK